MMAAGVMVGGVQATPDSKVQDRVQVSSQTYDPETIKPKEESKAEAPPRVYAEEPPHPMSRIFSNIDDQIDSCRPAVFSTSTV